MASIKEIRTHIKSVEQTLKITNAMYLISSSSLRKARRQLTDVEPYFSKIEATISDILHHSPEIDHRFFDKRPGIPPDKRKTGFIVITGDKGLAGAYNHNILKLAEEKMSRAANPSLFVVGQVGRSYFLEHGIPIDADLVFDVRFLPNPYYIAELRHQTGLDEGVYSFVFGYQQTKDFMAHLESLIGFLLPQYVEEGKAALVIGIGCTGGQHRSVAITKALADFIKQKGYQATENHRDMTRA